MSTDNLGDAVLTIKTDTAAFDAGLDSVAKKTVALGQGFKQTEGSAKSLGKEVSSLQGSLSGLFGTIVKGVATGELLTDGIKELGHAMAGALEAVPHLVEQTMHLGAELLTTSLKTGISVEGISKLRYVAAQTGTDLGGLTNAIFKMEANLGTGSKKVQEALKAVGLSLKDLKTSAPDEAFIQILDKMHQMPDAAARAAAGVTIFGKGFKEVAQLAQEDVRGLIEEAQRLGIVMTTETAASAKAAEDAMRAFTFQVEATANRIGAAFLPAIIGISSDLSVGFKAAIEAANDGLKQMGGSGGFLATVVAAMGTGDAAIEAQTQLYYELRDALISVVQHGIEPFVTTFGFVMTEVNAAKVVWHDLALLIDEVALALDYAVRANALFHGDLATASLANKDIERTTNAIYAQIAAITDAKKNEKEWGEWAKSINASIEAGLTKVKDSHVDVAGIIKKVADMSRAAAGQMGDAFEGEGEKAEKAFKKISEGALGMSATMGAVALQLRGTAGDFAKTLPQLEGRLFGTGMSQPLSRLSLSGSESFVANPQFGVNAGIGLGPAKIGRKTFETPISGFMSNLAAGVPNAIVAAIQGGGSKLEAAGSAIGSSLFGPQSKATTAISKGLSNLFGPNSFLTSTLSQAVPIIGSLIGPAISGLGKLFSKAFGTAGRDAVRSFADSAGGFDALHKQLAALGSEGEKMWVSLTQGVGRNNPDQAKAVIAGISEKLDAARSTVHQAITDTQTLSERLSHVTEITPELQTALDAALNAKTPQEYADAVAHIGGVMDTIDAKQQHLESTLTKYGIAWTDAGEAVKKAHIAGESEDIVSAWQEIRGAGVGVFQTMEGMGKSVNDFVHDAQKAGVEVPSSMKEIIQAAIDNGKVFDENGKKITDIKDLGLTFGDTMETVMKKTIPDAIAKLTTVLEGLAKFLKITLPGAAEEGAADTQNSLDGITPPDLTVHVKTQFDPAHAPDYNNPDNAPPPEGSWRGSFVRPWGLQYLAAGGLAAALATGAFIPRGSDTIPAMLTPGEGVVNTLGMSHLGIDGLRSLNHGEPLATGGTDTSRLEAQMAAVKQGIDEAITVLDGIEQAIQANRITSVEANGRELLKVTIDTLDQNPGGLRTEARQVLGIT